MSTIDDGVKTEVVAIDPQGAEELLGHNINNRDVVRVRDLAQGDKFWVGGYLYGFEGLGGS